MNMRTKDYQKAIEHLDKMYIYLLMPERSYYTLQQLKNEISAMKQIFIDLIIANNKRGMRTCAALRTYNKVTTKKRKV